MKKLFTIFLLIILITTPVFNQKVNKFEKQIKRSTYLFVFSDAVFASSLLTGNFVLMTTAGSTLLIATMIKISAHSQANMPILNKKNDCINKSEKRIKKKYSHGHN